MFEDNEAVINMIIKGRSPTMRHVPRAHRVAFDWLFDRINLDSKIQIKYIETNNQLADVLTKGNFKRDEWNHLLCLFNISHFSSTVCSEAMAKRFQQDSGEERVTAKSRPTLSLIARVVARVPSTLSSSASESPEKKSYESQSPGVRKLRSMIERGNPLSTVTNNLLKARTQQAAQGGTMIKLGLLKKERGHPLSPHGQGHTSSNQVSVMRRPSTLFLEEEETHDRTGINSHEAMSNRTQEDVGEERVTAKSKPMMNLVSRYRVRDPNVLASTASESPGTTKSESQNLPLSSLNVQQTSTGRSVLGDSSSNYSEWNVDDKRSSQVWKSGDMLGARTERPVDDKFVVDDDMDSDTVTESNLSLRSRSFLNRVNDRLPKILDHSSKDAMQDIDKRSMIWGMFMSSTLEASVFMGKD